MTDEERRRLMDKVMGRTGKKQTGNNTSKFRKVAVLLQLTNEEAHNANEVALVGEFNNWNKKSHIMKKTITGFEITIELSKGNTYQFKYVLDGQTWINDPMRKIVDDGQGNWNSVIEL